MRLIDADALLEQYNLKDATKYGNKNAEQQAHSYSTMMLYEIADMIEDAPTAYDVDKVVEQLEEAGKTKLIAHGGRCNGKTLALGYAKGIENAISIVNQLAEEYRQDLDKNSQGWISCSERLPERNGMYLVTQKRYSLDTRRMIGIETDYVQFSCGEWCRARFLEVIAWQPLPSPYQPKDCSTCANNTDFDEVDNGCYMCCKGLENNYQPKGE